MNLVMIYLFLIAMLSTNVWSNGYIKQDDALDCTKHKVSYGNRSNCEKAEGSVCLQTLSNYDELCSAAELQDYYIDDPDKPINSKTDAEVCSGEENCQEILGNKVCLDIEEMSYINAEFTEVYCSKLTGYEQKLASNKKMVYNETTKQNLETAKVNAETDKAMIELAIKAMACGNKVKARMAVRNAVKSLTNAQKKQLVDDNASIIRLLESGSLDTARAEMVATVPDGVLVTEGDKTALLLELDSCN